MLDALILDIDGTLIDSNAEHAEAWRRAIERLGYRVGLDRIFSQIGKGGDTFVPGLLGEEVNQKDGDTLRKFQPEEFEKIAKAKGLRVFPGTRELLAEAKKRGLRLVVATSGNKKQLELNEECSGLQISKLVDEVVNASDIETSKPAPDLVTAAYKKLKLSPAQCAMIGDTPYDAESAKHAGVVCLGVTCGGHAGDELRSNGARAIFRDPADILAHFDKALQIASPGPIRLTQTVLETLMREALATAGQAIDDGEVPIGSILAHGDGTIISRAHNGLNRTKNKTAHAEMMAFVNAAGKYPPDARDLILVSTLEPCVMCLGAAMEASIDTIVYGLKAPFDSGTARVSPPKSPESGMPRIIGDVLADKSRRLFEQWLKSGDTSNPLQLAFVKQLLSAGE